MNDQVNEAPTEQSTAEAAPEQTETLESLYNQYQIPQEQAPLPSAVEPPAQQYSEPSEPQSQEELNAALLKEVRQIRQERAQEQAAKTAKVADQDFDTAVAAIGKEAGLDQMGLEGWQKVVKGYVIAEALDDNRLRLLFDKRHTNPTAWAKAQNVIAKDIASKFKLANPQLEENQRAMEESQKVQSSAPPTKSSAEDKAMGLNNAEFDHLWRQLVGGGR